MTIKTYLVINVSTNIVDNLCAWDGNPDTWEPPPSHIVLEQDITPAMIWLWDDEIKDFALTEQIGQGNIGFTWDGTVLTTNEPKPEPPKPAEDQPAADGLQTI